MRRTRRLLLSPAQGALRREPETIVRVPPLDAELTAAIKLIAPQYHLPADEAGRRLWERDQNDSCHTEDAALGGLLRAMPTPRRVLELGPGLGRSAVFWSKRHFPDADFALFDATGHDTKYELLGSRHADSFCGNLPQLKRCLEHNGMRNYHVLDAGASGGRLPRPEVPYDFCYSFFAVGFHWSLDHWLDELLAVGGPNTLYAFTVASHFEFPSRVRAMPHRLLQAHSGLNPQTTTYFCVFVQSPQPWFPA